MKLYIFKEIYIYIYIYGTTRNPKRKIYNQKQINRYKTYVGCEQICQDEQEKGKISKRKVLEEN